MAVDEDDDYRAVFVYEQANSGEWFFVLIDKPTLFHSTANWLVEGYFNQEKSEAFGPFEDRTEALEKATALLESNED